MCRIPGLVMRCIGLGLLSNEMSISLNHSGWLHSLINWFLMYGVIGYNILIGPQ